MEKLKFASDGDVLISPQAVNNNSQDNNNSQGDELFHLIFRIRMSPSTFAGTILAAVDITNLLKIKSTESKENLFILEIVIFQ